MYIHIYIYIHMYMSLSRRIVVIQTEFLHSSSRAPGSRAQRGQITGLLPRNLIFVVIIQGYTPNNRFSQSSYKDVYDK